MKLETMYENNFLLLVTINADINIIKKTEMKNLTPFSFNSLFWFYFFTIWATLY